MAAKLKCPSCKRVLKEAGDNSKRARGEYLVWVDEKHKGGLIECCECQYMGEVKEFDQ